jgi:diadenosine tetraphosphatase ApaH/serine/threonine PP2A family protein phosphatase
VRSVTEVTLLGNHDAAVAGRMDYSFYYDAARHALDWSANVLSEENLAWLRSLPYTYRLGEVGFCHGSPVDPKAYEYIFALEQARELTEYVAELPEVTFIGHSHLCKAFAIGNGEVNDVVAQKFGIRRGYKYLISVGSVGQPRDYDNRACFVICDTTARTVEYLRVEYDIDAAAQKIYDADLALNFGKRLYLGV